MMQRKRSMSVRDRMSRRVTTVRPEARLSEAAQLMRTRKVRHLPVVDHTGRVVGMVTERVLRQALVAPARIVLVSFAPVVEPAAEVVSSGKCLQSRRNDARSAGCDEV